MLTSKTFPSARPSRPRIIPVSSSRFGLAGLLLLGIFLAIQPAQAAPNPFLKANGVNIRNNSGQGDAVPLRGVNLGGWLVMEPWMCPMDSTGLADSYSALQALDTHFSVATEQTLIAVYQSNWITTSDLDKIKSLGMNVVRLPFWWGNVETLAGTWRPDAFARMDWLVTNAWQRGIYTIIDFHGIPGGQSTDQDTGQQNQNKYWTNTADQIQTSLIWSNVVAHFKGNPAVAGYDLLNEPTGAPTRSSLWVAYNSLYQTIRAVDPDHMIIVEGAWAGPANGVSLNWQWDVLPPPTMYGWTNIVYSMHAYPGGSDTPADETSKQVSDFNSHLSWNVPCLIGEFNWEDNTAADWQNGVQQFDQNNMSWTDWAYKATSGNAPNSWGIFSPTGSGPTKPNLASDSFGTISNDWFRAQTPTTFALSSFLKQDLGAPLAVADAYTNTGGTLNVASPGVLANDLDTNSGLSGITLTAVLVDSPANGQVTLNANGSFAYAPTAGFSGTDTFSYRDNDGYASSANIATVSIQVGASQPVVPAQTRVETAADGSGAVVPAQNLTAGTALTLYAIARDAGGNFISNAAAVWSLQNTSGGIVGGDLAVAGDSRSATFTGHAVGGAVIRAVANTFTGQSGALTVTPAAWTQLLWSTQPGSAAAGSPFGIQPVLKTADQFGNPSAFGLPASLGVTVGLSAGTGPLIGTTNYNLGTAGGDGVVNFTDLEIDSPGTNKQLTASAGGAGTQPNNVANCQLWLDASDLSTLTLSGGAVTAWADKSGQGNNATAGTAPILATNVYLPATSAGLGRVVRFDGLGSYLNVNLGALNGNPYTIIALEVNAGKTNNSYFIGNTGGALDQALHMGYPDATGKTFRLGQWSDDLTYSGLASSTTTPRLWTGKLDATAGHFLYLNGALVANSASTAPVTGNLASGHIGSGFDTGNTLYRGDLAEIAVYSRALSDTERNQVEGYMNSKWLASQAHAVSAVFAVTGSLSQTNSVASAVLMANGTVNLGFIGTPGATYFVEAATNLTPPISWTPVPGSTNRVTNGNGLWSCTIAITNPAQYYRSAVANP